MTPQEIREVLSKTLDDRRLSRGEKQAIGSLMEELNPPARMLNVYRGVAFDLAREVLHERESGAVIEWLEDVVRVLQSVDPRTSQSSVAESLFSPDDDCPARIASLLSRAKNRVDICVFTITDNRISSEIQKAHRRKVDVRIITDDEKSGDLGSDIEDLAAAGIPVRIDRTQYHMHHKFAVFDRELLLTGSYNWTRGAAENNEENLIITDDQRLVSSFSNVFEKLWRGFA